MITRRILVTTTRDKTGKERRYYGRYDAVSLAARGETVTNAEFRMYHAKEEDFVMISKEEN